jgi:hypothetical protein
MERDRKGMRSLGESGEASCALLEEIYHPCFRT